jgi:hypothetical protein
MCLREGFSSCPQGKDYSGVAGEERSGFIRAKDLPSGNSDLNSLDYNLWALFGGHGLPKPSQQTGQPEKLE